MSPPAFQRTLREPVEHWIDPIKGSRFVGLAAPVADEAAAEALIHEARTRWPDARHHCWAWRLRDDRTRSSDDGEPGGSAGRPILSMIEGHELHGVCVVVVRWFGGVKLGVGGLIRAYGGCAGKTLDRGELVTLIPTVDLRVDHAWEDSGPVQAVLGARGVVPVSADYGARANLLLRVQAHQAEDLKQVLVDGTGGRVRLDGP